MNNIFFHQKKYITIFKKVVYKKNTLQNINNMHLKKMNISRKQRRGCNSTRSNRTNRSNRTKRTINKKQIGGGENITIKWGKKVFENVPVNMSISVDELKIQLSKLSGVPADKMKLLKSGKALKDEQSLELSGIQNGSVVHMIGTKVDSKQHPNGTSVNLPRSKKSKKSKKSFRSFRSNRSMKPKFKSSMSAPARAHSAPTGVQKSADYFDDYTIFTYDNSPESRAMIGLDHPMLADVTVNDYIHASCRVNEDLVNNSLKPIEEKLALMKLSRKFFADVYDALPRGMGDNPHVKTTPSKGKRQSLEPTVASMVPKLIEHPRIAVTAATGGARVHVSNQFSGLTVDEPPVVNLGEQEDAAIPFIAAVSEKPVDLKSLLTYDKLRHFITLSENNTNHRLGWARRASLFIKYMFLPEDVFRVNVLHHKTLTGYMTGKRVENYKFKFSSSSHKIHPGNSEKITVSIGPPLRIKVEGAARTSLSMVLDSEMVMPVLNCDMHTQNSFEDMDISMFQGRFNKLSPIQKKHIIYSIILFILKNLNSRQLNETIQTWTHQGFSEDVYNEIVAPHRLRESFSIVEEQGENISYETKLLREFKSEFTRISKEYSRVIPDDVLPYSAFFATFSKDSSSTFNTYLQMTRPHDPEVLKKGFVATAILTGSEVFGMPHGYKSYFNLIEYFYKKIMMGFTEDVMQSSIAVGDSTKPKVVIAEYKTNPKDLSMFIEVKNQDIVSFQSTGGRDIKDGVGMIIGKEGPIVAESAFFYTENSDDITIPYMDIKSGEQRELVLKNGGVADPPDNIMHTIWQTKSRIASGRDNLMGHLSNLVYHPNDVINTFSRMNIEHGIEQTTAVKTNMLLYVGAFDHDPSFPYAFYKNHRGSFEGPMPCFSRVHVWLKTFHTTKDHELYLVFRGSKTGYDWDSCDIDIIVGILQNERSTHLPNVLRGIISYLNSCLHGPTESLDFKQKNIAKALNNGVGEGVKKAIQMFTTGHSLGGYLAMSISHIAIAENITNGFSFEKITGVTRTAEKSNEKLYLKPYIIPIVFDPYLGMSSSIHNAFSFLPYVRIHSCIESKFRLEPIRESTDVLRSHDYPLTSAIALTDGARYDDVASRNFLSFIRQKYSIRKYNDTMGQFFIFHYSNIYNFFKHSGIYYQREGLLDRATGDMRCGHDLRHMIGISSDYLINHIPTKFFVRTGLTRSFIYQNLQPARYNFPIPKNLAVIPYFLNYEGEPTLSFELFSVKAIRDNPEDYDIGLSRKPNPVIKWTRDDILWNTDFKNHYYKMYPFLKPKTGSPIGVNSDFSTISVVGLGGMLEQISKNIALLDSVVNKQSSYSIKTRESLDMRADIINRFIHEENDLLFFNPQARTEWLANRHAAFKNEMLQFVISDEDLYSVL